MHPPSSARPARPLVPPHVPLMRSLFVMRPTTCYDALKAVVSDCVVDAEVVRVESLGEALGLIGREPVDMLVVDRAIDPAGASILIWHQRIACAQSLVLAFDDFPLSPDGGSYRVWSWTDARAVLRSALDQRSAGMTASTRLT